MTNLTTFCAVASELRVMELRGRGAFDVGTAAAHFGPRLAIIQVGDSQGEDSLRGAYDWWPLTINGRPVGELRDDASGMTIHIVRNNHPNRTAANISRRIRRHIVAAGYFKNDIDKGLAWARSIGFSDAKDGYILAMSYILYGQDEANSGARFAVEDGCGPI